MKLDMATRARAWQAQSLLLGYPDPPLVAALPLLTRAAASLPAVLGDPLQPLLQRLNTEPLLQLAASYTETFDHQSKFSPYLTYFAHGDTRKRGMALLEIKQVYRHAGLVPHDGELPDHLAVVLEFAAHDAEAGIGLLTKYRAGVELMRLGLMEQDSPWGGVLESVSATLPGLRGTDRDAVARLAAAGPPGEQVGLEPFAPPSYMPEPAGGCR